MPPRDAARRPKSSFVGDGERVVRGAGRAKAEMALGAVEAAIRVQLENPAKNTLQARCMGPAHVRAAAVWTMGRSGQDKLAELHRCTLGLGKRKHVSAESGRSHAGAWGERRNVRTFEKRREPPRECESPESGVRSYSHGKNLKAVLVSTITK